MPSFDLELRRQTQGDFVRVSHDVYVIGGAMVGLHGYRRPMNATEARLLAEALMSAAELAERYERKRSASAPLEFPCHVKTCGAPPGLPCRDRLGRGLNPVDFPGGYHASRVRRANRNARKSDDRAARYNVELKNEKPGADRRGSSV